MNLIRKLKISEIIPIKFTEKELIIIKLFEDNLKDLTIFIRDKNPLNINYMKDGSWIMQDDTQCNTQCNTIFISDEIFNFVLKQNFNLSLTEYKDVCLYMIIKIFKFDFTRYYKYNIGFVEKKYIYSIERDFLKKYTDISNI